MHGMRTTGDTMQNIRLGARRLAGAALAAGAALSVARATAAPAAPDMPPNILVIWGDDIGIWNLSAYSRGV